MSPALEALREARDDAQHQAVTMRERLVTMRAEHDRAQQVFTETNSDTAWRKVISLRTEIERTELSVTGTATRAASARAAYERAVREDAHTRATAAVEGATPDAFRGRIAPMLAELAACDARACELFELLEAERVEQCAAVGVARVIAAQAGIVAPRVEPVTAVALAHVVTAVVGEVRVRAGIAGHVGVTLRDRTVHRALSRESQDVGAFVERVADAVEASRCTVPSPTATATVDDAGSVSL